MEWMLYPDAENQVRVEKVCSRSLHLNCVSGLIGHVAEKGPDAFEDLPSSVTGLVMANPTYWRPELQRSKKPIWLQNWALRLLE